MDIFVILSNQRSIVNLLRDEFDLEQLRRLANILELTVDKENDKDAIIRTIINLPDFDPYFSLVDAVLHNNNRRNLVHISNKYEIDTNRSKDVIWKSITQSLPPLTDSDHLV